MSYKIEYLAESKVVHLKMPFATDLGTVTTEARSGSSTAKALFGANSFQIRDMSADGQIVLSEAFKL